MATKAPKLDQFKKKFEQDKQARARFEPDWYLSQAYYLGDQWAFWNRTRLDRPIPRSGQVLDVDNRIQGIVGTRLARKTKSRPSWVAEPASIDDSAVMNAQIGEKVLDADWDALNLTHKLLLVLLYTELCTAGFWKVFWDDKAGDKADFAFDEAGQPLQDENGRPVRAGGDTELPDGYGARSIAEGNVCVEVISPFELFPQAGMDTLEDCEHVTECKIRSPEYVRKRFGEVMEPDTDVPVDITDGRLLSPLVNSQAPVVTKQDRAKGIKVYEHWQRPSTDWPDGIRICWAKDKVLAFEQGPHDTMPYVMFSGPLVPGRFWPTSVVSQLRGPQTALNKIKSQIRETAMRLGNPILLWSKFAGECTYQGLPGEVLQFDDSNPNAKPSYLQAPEIPVYVQNEIERIEGALQEISGLHEVSKATVPTGVTAASAINLLQEADDTRLGPEVALMEQQIGKAGDKMLRLRAKYTAGAQLLRIAGEDGDWDIQDFRGKMLDSVRNVTVQSGSMMPKSKAAKQAAMVEVFQLAVQYGLPLQPRNIRRFFKDYEVGGIDRLFADLDNGEGQVKWENRMLRSGQQLPINPFDDDDLHIAGHEEDQKSSRWRRLDEEQQAIFQKHVNLHRQRRVKAYEQERGAQARAAQAAIQEQADAKAGVEQVKSAGQVAVAAAQPDQSQNGGGNAAQ